MVKQKGVAAGVLILCVCLSVPVAAQRYAGGKTHAGLTVGAGLPKVPFSLYHPPVSVCASIWAQTALSAKFSVRAGGLLLHTFNLGTVTGENRELRFDLGGGSLELFYLISRDPYSEQAVGAGVGRYFLNQAIDEKIYKRSVYGIHIGFCRWVHHAKFSNSFEIKWILLNHPAPRPQVLIITFGWLL